MDAPAPFAIRPILRGRRLRRGSRQRLSAVWRPAVWRPAVWRSAVWRSGSAGFTMIELLVTMTLALVVLTAVSSLLIDGLHDQAAVETRSSQLDQAQVAMQRLVRNLRDASNVTVLSAGSISYSEPVPTGFQSVTFSCSTVTSTCTSTSGGVQQTAITSVTNGNVFAAYPSNSSPTYIGITLVLSAPHDSPVTVTDGTGLRNVTLGQ